MRKRVPASFVISVGNIAMGGRGKTPLVGLIARVLIGAGERPAILTRGYGRRRRDDGVTIVSDGEHVLADVDRAGDEPLLLARSVPGAAVLVCEQRAIAAALAESQLGSTVHLLDDGFQHRSMPRDVDIVAIAPQDLEDRRVPLGRLRESPSALSRADAVVIDGPPEASGGFDHPRIFALTRHLGDAVSVDAVHAAPAKGTGVVAVAGIAQPDRFSRALEQAGWQVRKLLRFRDHHRFGVGDVRGIERAVREAGAAGVVTTEKDAMRLRLLRPFAVPVAFVPLVVRVEPPAEFESWLLGRVRERRG
ncbi:MAG TPA: tetraacyldisaccharide 4'-kinase [Vicinamibacterales bacterium]|nr:tetraacyldisaccharide 4'-kinase [Vicinamibacterales bacterium]